MQKYSLLTSLFKRKLLLEKLGIRFFIEKTVQCSADQKRNGKWSAALEG